MSLVRRAVPLVLTFAALALPSAAVAAHAGPLAAQWHFDQVNSPGATDISPDSSGHGLDLTSGDNATVLDAPGKFGSFLSATGNQLLATPSVPLLKPQQVTLLAWVKAPEPTGFEGQIAGHLETSSQFTGCTTSYSLDTPANTGVRFQVRGLGQDYFSPNSGPGIWNDQWHLVAGVYDGQRVRLYVDGTQVGSGTVGPGSLDHEPGAGFYVNGNGVEECSSSQLNGGIDEVRVYRRALTATELGRLAATPSGPNAPALVADSPPPPPPSGGAGGVEGNPVAKLVVPPNVRVGRLATINATGTVNAKFLRFDTNDDGNTDAICPGHAPVLETRLTAGSKRITVTALSFSGLAARASARTFVQGPKVKTLRARKRPPVAFKCLLDKTRYPNLDSTAAGDTGGGGGPPAGCADTIQFDFIQAVGCLDRVDSGSDIPALERPILDELVRYWNASPQLREVVLGPCKREIIAGLRPKNSCPPKEIINRSGALLFVSYMDLQVSRRPVRINGLDFIPSPGSAIVLAPQISRVVSSNALVKAGVIPLKAGRINLDVEKGKLPGGQNLRTTVPLGSFDAKRDLKLAGFPLNGQIDATIGRIFVSLGRNSSPKAVQWPSFIKARLALPTELSLSGGQPATFAVDLTTDNTDGLQLSDFRGRIPSVFIGPLQLTNFFANYSKAGKSWSAGGNIILGDAKLGFAPPPALNGIGFRDGRISHVGATLKFGSPIPPLQIFPGVFLDEVGFGMRFRPTVLRGEVEVSALKTVKIRGAVLVAFPSAGRPYTLTSGDAGEAPEAKPYSLGGVGGAALAPLVGRTFRDFTVAAGGTVKLIAPVINEEIPLGNGYFVSSGSYVGFGGHMSYGAAGFSAKGQIDGAYSTSSNRFNLEGRVELCAAFGLACPNVSGVVSSRGIAGCAGININLLLGEVRLSVGAGYSWRDGLTIYLLGCDIGPYRAQVARVSQTGARTVTLGRGLPNAMIRLEGRPGSAPRVKITTPDGDSVSTAAPGLTGSRSQRLLAARNDPAGLTFVGVKKPVAGRYRIEPLPGSGPITKVSTANGLAPAKVRARVSGSGARRRLRYSVLRRPGQRVTFEERGAATSHVIGSTTGGKGSLRFKPAVGPGGRRQIVARVELGGLPNKNLTVARFRVRDTLTPGRVSKLRVKRSRRGVTVRFKSARNAKRYQVLVKRRDGTTRLIRTRRRSLRVKLPRTQSGRVYVLAIGPTDMLGRPRSTRFKFNLRPATKFQKYKRGRGKLPKRKRRG